jgi:hypothetical protein
VGGGTSLTEIGEEAFNGCVALEKIDFGSSIDDVSKLDASHIGDNAFNDCPNGGVVWGSSTNVGRNFLTAVHNDVAS